MDILTHLSAEHEDLRVTLAQIEIAAEARDEASLTARLEAARAALTGALDAHIAAEEAEAFPVIAGALGDDLLRPFYEDHAEITSVRDELYGQLARGVPPYEPSLRLCALILSHQEREDVMLFPSAREAARL